MRNEKSPQWRNSEVFHPCELCGKQTTNACDGLHLCNECLSDHDNGRDIPAYGYARIQNPLGQEIRVPIHDSED